ncbi:hypothetical protein SS50377_26677 [Spironucleus salmonicida]|uniref:Uncharacterized protein n=1 Tax=Spironucleus salmonicida TaxID=348837 RepID=V6LY36_9EUKA|nr:hypothetical protein SS50377_26677 [Spironucleus salmonicida]|eukprot:EST49153.1 Hypothetical protein SS50377_10366 [Spironucleus salmonicida]
MLTDTIFLEQCKQHFNLDEYLSLTEQSKLNWRFTNLPNMDYNQLMAFFEYCIEPEEIRNGYIYNIEGDFKEAELRQLQLSEELDQITQQQLKLQQQLAKKEQEYKNFQQKQHNLDTTWKLEQEVDKDAFDELME